MQRSSAPSHHADCTQLHGGGRSDRRIGQREESSQNEYNPLLLEEENIEDDPRNPKLIYFEFIENRPGMHLNV
jgi:hypothetical protein